MGDINLIHSLPSVRVRCLVPLFLTLWTCLGPRPASCLAHQWPSLHCTRRHPPPLPPWPCRLSSTLQRLGWLLPSPQLPPSRQLLCRLLGRLPPRPPVRCPVLAKPRAPLLCRRRPRWHRSHRPQPGPRLWPPLRHRSSPRPCTSSPPAHRWDSRGTPRKSAVRRLLPHLRQSPNSVP